MLATAVAGSVLTAGSALASTPATGCAESADGGATAAACTPYWKESEGWSSQTACNRAGNEGAQAGRWTGWNCSKALGGWELWVRDCSLLAGEPAAVPAREDA
ncbi:hypothetical protein [Goodfellowiella coeruleoviolacea]|uniref:hypothetical protein n=1 Tax=Goodfellowiella coeruleoviolacea TaxID=334858 RepID=UPI0020A51A2C|nr:hypothetical protein [Goodfellowiella coeruleoviolacea]